MSRASIWNFLSSLPLGPSQRASRVHWNGGKPGRRLFALVVAVVLLAALVVPEVHAASRAILLMPDLVCLPHQTVQLEARLYRTGLFGLFQSGISGEVLRFLDPRGKALGEVLTDRSGTARVPYRVGGPGLYRLGVRLPANPRYEAEAASGRLFVWAPDLPVLFVELEEGLMPPKPSSFLRSQATDRAPLPGAVPALERIGPCRGIVYLSRGPETSVEDLRLWLKRWHFPAGPLFFLACPSSGLFSGGCTPGLGRLESVRRGRDSTLELVTRDQVLADTASESGIRVLLLTSSGASGASSAEKAPDEEGEGRAEILPVRDWDEVAEMRGCKGMPTTAAGERGM